MVPKPSPTLRTEGLVDQERVRAALRALREAIPKGITREQLRGALDGASLRTIDRALQLLEAQGAVLERIREGGSSVIRFHLRKGPAWDEHISSEARLALRLAGLALAQSGTLLWQEKLETLERLASERMSSRDRKVFEQLQRAIRVQGGVEDPIESPDILEPLLAALEKRREVTLEYQAATAKAATPLSVVPYAITHDLFSGGAFLLVWEPARRLPLHLRLSRIGKVKVTSRPGLLPEATLAQAADFQIGGWTSGEPPFEVVARIEGAHWIQAFREAPPALPAFQSDAIEGGRAVRVRFQANHAYGATRWLMQFGAAAVVESPSALRDEIRAQFQRALESYSTTFPGAPELDC